MWARTGCKFDANGIGPCEVGECGNKLQCNGTGEVPPVSLALFAFGNPDFYGVDFTDGYNVAIQVRLQTSKNILYLDSNTKSQIN
jgi:hypothetical protein